jgi:hypothetical protein
VTLSCEGCGRRCRSEALSACYNPARSPAWWRALCSRAFLDRHVRAKRWYPATTGWPRVLRALARRARP